MYRIMHNMNIMFFLPMPLEIYQKRYTQSLKRIGGEVNKILLFCCGTYFAGKYKRALTVIARSNKSY